MSNGKDLNMSVLLDYYSAMLTDKQKDVMELYYNEDLSLGEIADYAGITRQGVRDSIKRGEQILLETEEKLGCCRKAKQFREIMDSVEKLAYDIARENDTYDFSKGLGRRADAILGIIRDNKELF